MVARHSAQKRPSDQTFGHPPVEKSGMYMRLRHQALHKWSRMNSTYRHDSFLFTGPSASVAFSQLPGHRCSGLELESKHVAYPVSRSSVEFRIHARLEPS
ncbi:unnamed protein product [Protopolystoma xenopodis]|uniref:Uncharacterized protein n=1 Tax=Protopolystoma xenopodis TaxID=117903 RepID=A0A448WGS2_9PLAT|nr:unnamed protein product [Protopolystoma xenopodis]